MKFVKNIKGYAYQDVKTKCLVERLPKKSIAVISHQDIDVVAAEMLIKCGVKAVINLKQSMSGLFFHRGVDSLLEANIEVFDIEDSALKEINLEGQLLLINHNTLFKESDGSWQPLCELKKYDIPMINELRLKAKSQFVSQFKAFVGNSLYYCEKELKPFVGEVQLLPILRQFLGKEVLIVARGANYEKDLHVLRKIIVKRNLITIAVDGGADALLNVGIKPDFIIGDMDSVSERALKSGAELLIHTYRDGRAPGEVRVKSLQLPYKRLQFLGTSEDVAIIFAYCSGAERLYTIGTRVGMNEFLEKGRVGMGSSLLTRMKVGHALVDLKGVHSLFEEEEKSISSSVLMIPALVALLMISFNPKIDVFVSLVLQWWGGR